MKRCAFDHGGLGPQCCIESKDGTHDGSHRFKCAGVSCPGLIWPASVMAHPNTCTDITGALRAAGCVVIHAADLPSETVIEHRGKSADRAAFVVVTDAAIRAFQRSGVDPQVRAWCTMATEGNDAERAEYRARVAAAMQTAGFKAPDA